MALNNARLQTYLNQLGLGSPFLNIDFVEQLQSRHLAEFSFSSINAMGNDFLSLDEEVLFNRLIEKRLGGYCFEHNKIAYLALLALGFQARPVLARVLLNGTTTNPRTHRLTLVTVGNCEYLVDVGFGVKAPVKPLPINENGRVNQGCHEYEIQRNNNHIVVSMLRPEKVTLYEVDLTVVNEEDCNVAHFYSHQYPAASFVNNLVVARIEEGKRYLIRNLSFSYWNEHTGTFKEQTISSAVQLQALLVAYFRVNFSLNVIESVYDKVVTRALGHQ